MTICDFHKLFSVVVRVLSGANDSFIYDISDGCCSVSSHVKVCHLTEVSFVLVFVSN